MSRQMLSIILFLNACGSTGATGPQGPAGADGSNGAAGTAGAPGNTGASGADGTDGLDGLDGTDGATGATGATGSPGYVATIIVAARGSANENGDALRAAVAGASTTATSLIKLDPGVYNIGTGPLDLPSLVHLEGAGMDLSTVQASGGAAVFSRTTGSGQLRAVTLQQLNGNYALATNATSPMLLDHVHVQASAASGTVVAILADGSIVLRDCVIEATSPDAVVGLAASGAILDMRDTRARVLTVGSNTFATAVKTLSTSQVVTISDSLLEASGPSIAQAVDMGANVGASRYKIEGTTMTATSVTGGQTEGLRVLQGASGSYDLEIAHSTLAGSDGSFNFGVDAQGDSTNSVFIEHSSLVAVSSSVNQYTISQQGGVAVRVVSSRIEGGVFGSMSCLYCYDGAPLALDTTCH